MMGEESSRRWDELDSNCLANVFGRVGMETLLASLPFVCKSCYSTTLNPSCWKRLNFPTHQPLRYFVDDDNRHQLLQIFGPFYDKFLVVYGIDKTRFSITGFIKMVVSSSHGKTVALKLPEFCNEEALRSVSENCPLLRDLYWVDDLVIFKASQVLPKLIKKWKSLENLFVGGNLILLSNQAQLSKPYLCNHVKVSLKSHSIESDGVLNRILVQVGTHCKGLTDLSFFQVNASEIEASTIVNLLPNIKRFIAVVRCIERDSVVRLLQDCKQLALVEFRQCEGFEDGDEDILKLGARIVFFRCKDCVTCVDHTKFGSGLVHLFRRVIFSLLNR